MKYLTEAFPVDNYTKHQAKQHPMPWSKYQAGTDEEKKTFFDTIFPVKETLCSHYTRQKVAKHFLLDAPIVNVIIGDMLWDPEDIDGYTHAKMLSSFQYLAGAAEDQHTEEEDDRLYIFINNPIQFTLAIYYIHARCSFRQAADVMCGSKDSEALGSGRWNHATKAS